MLSPEPKNEESKDLLQPCRPFQIAERCTGCPAQFRVSSDQLGRNNASAH